MARKKFTSGQDVEVRGVSHLGWRPAVYVGIYVGANAAHRGRHVVESLTTGQRVVPDGRIRARGVST